ncbi:MAG: conjugal transfer protein TraD, partial [Firmicutes bacterium]|nr:conjugal transfer protein TraD [Bacillota bacterium]
EKKLRAQYSKEERKKRTKRLIELGGIVCKVVNEDTLEGDAAIDEKFLTNLLAFLKNQNERGNYFTKAVHLTPKANEDSTKEKTETAISPSKSDDDEMPF